MREPSLDSTQFASGSTIHGDLEQDDGEVRIAGDFNGTIQGARLTVRILAGGSVVGTIRAQRLFVEGTLACTGPVTAIDSVHIHDGGVFRPDAELPFQQINTASFVMDDGAVFCGRVETRFPRDPSEPDRSLAEDNDVAAVAQSTN